MTHTHTHTPRKKVRGDPQNQKAVQQSQTRNVQISAFFAQAFTESAFDYVAELALLHVTHAHCERAAAS